MREYAKKWRAVGFRSPATHRVWEWMPLLGFDYDSSFPDTDPYEPQPGGCCTWLPYFNEELVELPITLVQDYTLFTILRHEDERLWLGRAHFLREHGGMALVDHTSGLHARAPTARSVCPFPRCIPRGSNCLAGATAGGKRVVAETRSIAFGALGPRLENRGAGSGGWKNRRSLIHLRSAVWFGPS